MAEWHPIQHSFSGGEISTRMIMRTDVEKYRESLFLMRNWIPTLQGSAVRMPGSRYIALVLADNDPDNLKEARCVAFLDANNQPSMAVFNKVNLFILTDIDVLGGSAFVGKDGAVTQATGYRKEIVKNSKFVDGLQSWLPSYVNAGTPNQGAQALKTVSIDGVNRLQVNDTFYGYSNTASIIVGHKTTFTQTLIVDIASDTISVSTDFTYSKSVPAEGTPTNLTQKIKYVITVNSTDAIFNGDIARFEYEPVENIPLNTNLNVSFTGIFNLPVLGFTGNLYLRVGYEIQSEIPNPGPSLDPVYVIPMRFTFSKISVLADALAPGAAIPLLHPYTQDELKDLHYVQSPYERKEVVFTHKNHKPHWLYWDVLGAQYVFEEVTIVGEPVLWAVGNYPATCTSYQGRLYLAGAGITSETAWGSVPGVWETFTLGSTPNDGIEFQTTYRSPITWMLGHKELLVGSIGLEYIVKSQNGLLIPGDIDARLHTTHGSTRVQPAFFGDEVLFAGEYGSKVRAAQANRDKEGWIAPDLTLLAPHITAVGIKRMVRVRNPHQILLCVLNDGALALLHYDSTVGISGWSRVTTQGHYVDVTVAQTAEGVDIPFLIVSRTTNGEKKLYLEAIIDWTEGTEWTFVDSNIFVAPDVPTNIFTGLDHLEGLLVDIVADDGYRGRYLVEGGQVELLTSENTPYNFNTALAGLPKESTLVTLPPVTSPVTGGAGSKKRYSEIEVRLRDSSLPIINGERPADRSPASIMRSSEPLEGLSTAKVTKLGWDEFQFITIEEDLPVRCEILGVYGKLASKSL